VKQASNPKSSLPPSFQRSPPSHQKQGKRTSHFLAHNQPSPLPQQPQTRNHKLFNNPFLPQDDGALFRFFSGTKVIQNRKLVHYLESLLNVTLIERDFSAPNKNEVHLSLSLSPKAAKTISVLSGSMKVPSEDFIVDDRTMVLLCSSTFLSMDIKESKLVEALVSFSLKYESCWLVLEYPHEYGLVPSCTSDFHYIPSLVEVISTKTCSIKTLPLSTLS